MPEPPRRPCAGRCGRLVERGHCPACTAKGGGPRGRRSSVERGYDSQWRKARLGWLARHPICNDPFGLHKGVIVSATEVDHIVPHKGDKTLFWDFATNIQSLCKSCHSRKTAFEGGFGNDRHL